MIPEEDEEIDLADRDTLVFDSEESDEDHFNTTDDSATTRVNQLQQLSSQT